MTLTPEPNPIRIPVHKKTRITVEPTEPTEDGLAKRPKTAISVILKKVWRRFVKIRGKLKIKIFFKSGPSEKSFLTDIFVTLSVEIYHL